MKLNAQEAVAILLMNRRKKRVERKQLTPGGMFLDDYGDLTAFSMSEDRGDLTSSNAFEDWNWSS